MKSPAHINTTIEIVTWATTSVLRKFNRLRFADSPPDPLITATKSVRDANNAGAKPKITPVIKEITIIHFKTYVSGDTSKMIGYGTGGKLA
jgi:hypothetical protein